MILKKKYKPRKYMVIVDPKSPELYQINLHTQVFEATAKGQYKVSGEMVWWPIILPPPRSRKPGRIGEIKTVSERCQEYGEGIRPKVKFYDYLHEALENIERMIKRKIL